VERKKKRTSHGQKEDMGEKKGSKQEVHRGGKMEGILIKDMEKKRTKSEKKPVEAIREKKKIVTEKKKKPHGSDSTCEKRKM